MNRHTHSFISESSTMTNTLASIRVIPNYNINLMGFHSTLLTWSIKSAIWPGQCPKHHKPTFITLFLSSMENKFSYDPFNKFKKLKRIKAHSRRSTYKGVTSLNTVQYIKCFGKVIVLKMIKLIYVHHGWHNTNGKTKSKMILCTSNKWHK